MKIRVTKTQFKLVAGQTINFCCEMMEDLVKSNYFSLSTETGRLYFYKDGHHFDVLYCPNCGKPVKYIEEDS
jgi:hypothetical protein